MKTFNKAVLCFLLCPMMLFGQSKKRSLISLWAFKEKVQQVNGISLGLFSTKQWNEDTTKTNVNGARIELVGAGVIVPLIPQSPIVVIDSILVNYKVQSKINGLSLSGAGAVCDCQINGLNVGFLGKIDFKTNGLSLAIFNFSQVHNGLQLGVFNETYKSNGFQMGVFNGTEYFKGVQFGASNSGTFFKGLQIGLFNKTTELKGVQIGLWNINNKRKLPLINWVL